MAAATNIAVTINTLTDSLDLELDQNLTVSHVRGEAAAHWHLDPLAFRLFIEDKKPLESVILKDIEQGEDAEGLEFSLIKIDRLLDLGEFDTAPQEGVSALLADGGAQMIRKETKNPDNNNVMLKREIREPCFVEFSVEAAKEEMVFGVTDEPEVVMAAQGRENLRLRRTWAYGKEHAMARGGRHRTHHPTLLCGGNTLQARGFQEGDTVGIFVDPDQTLVQFYRNTTLVTECVTLPARDYDRPLRMYVMLDAVGDRVDILRFGPSDLFGLEKGAKKVQATARLKPAEVVGGANLGPRLVAPNGRGTEAAAQSKGIFGLFKCW